MKRSTARAIDKLTLLGATLCLAGHTYDLPSAPFWESISRHMPYAPVLLLVAVGIFGALTPFESWTARSLINRNLEMKRQILSQFWETSGHREGGQAAATARRPWSTHLAAATHAAAPYIRRAQTGGHIPDEHNTTQPTILTTQRCGCRRVVLAG